MITLPLLLPGGSSQVGGRPSDLIQGGLSGAGSRTDLGKEGIMPIFRDMSGQAVATQMTQDAQDTEGSQPGQQWWGREQSQTHSHPYIPPQPPSATEAGMVPVLQQRFGNVMIGDSEPQWGDAGPSFHTVSGKTPLSHTHRTRLQDQSH